MFKELKDKLSIGTQFVSMGSMWTVKSVHSEYVRAVSVIDSETRKGTVSYQGACRFFTGEHKVEDIIKYYLNFGADESELEFEWDEEIGESKSCRFFDSVKKSNCEFDGQTLTYNDGRNVVEFL